MIPCHAPSVPKLCIFHRKTSEVPKFLTLMGSLEKRCKFIYFCLHDKSRVKVFVTYFLQHQRRGMLVVLAGNTQCACLREK